LREAVGETIGVILAAPAATRAQRVRASAGATISLPGFDGALRRAGYDDVL
jgi:hypothetical protein